MPLLNVYDPTSAIVAAGELSAADQVTLTANLHKCARTWAAQLRNPDKKQLRFNDIVECAIVYYQPDPFGGVRELILSCDKDKGCLYIKGTSMVEELTNQYTWMLDHQAMYINQGDEQ